MVENQVETVQTLVDNVQLSPMQRIYVLQDILLTQDLTWGVLAGLLDRLHASLSGTSVAVKLTPGEGQASGNPSALSGEHAVNTEVLLGELDNMVSKANAVDPDQPKTLNKSLLREIVTHLIELRNHYRDAAGEVGNGYWTRT